MRYILLFLIIILALGLRLFKLTHMVGFDFDQEYAAMFAQNVLQVYPIQLIGQGLSVQGLFMGPLYFYFLVPFFAATSLAPLGGYIGSIALGIIIIIAYYFIANQIFGKPAGIIAAFLRAVLYFKIQADWTMAPSYSSELAILITWFCLYKYWHGEHKYLIPLGFVFGLFTSFHPILFPFYLVFILIILLKRKVPRIKHIFLSAIAFLIPLVPLLLFEYFHNFLELKLLFSLKSTSGAEEKTFETLITYVTLLLQYPTTLFANILAGTAGWILSIALFIAFATFASKKLGFWKDRFHLIFLTATIVSFLLYYFLLPTHAPDYYFLGPQVVLLIYFVGTFTLLYEMKNKKVIFYALLFFISICNLFALFKLWQNPPPFSLAHKQAVIEEIAKRQNGNNKMHITYDIDFGQQYGFGYLTRAFKLDPQGGEGAPTYTIILPASKSKEKIDFTSGDIGLTIKN